MKHATMVAMRRKLQRGFSLITAIFLLVVIAGLGAMAVTFFTAQQQSSALDVLGSRAYQASRAGIEWGAYQVLQNSMSCPPPLTNNPLTLVGNLSGFAVNINVACNAAFEAASAVTVFTLTSTATQGTAGQSDYVERVMQATIASGVSSTDSGIVYQSESYNY
jgi:MSHA biogenesis protein MshP